MKLQSLLKCLGAFCLSAIIVNAQVAEVNEVAEQRFVNYRSGYNRDTLILQLLLDRQNLSGNCIDGVWGARTEIALATWQHLNELPATGVPSAAALAALGETNQLFTTHTVTQADYDALGSVPEAWEERAKLERMSYMTLQEKLAEQGHLSQRAIVRLNPTLNWPNPPIGSAVVLPHLPTTKLPTAGSLRIALGRTEITVFDTAGKLVALFPCSIALDKTKRPEGELEVKVAAANPNYTYDPQLFKPGAPKGKKLVIPPGPNNPVGVAWIGLSLQGYGIHGTPTPEQIGRAESKGCFRLANWNAQKLLKMVEIGTPVVIEN